ncbi:MAG: DMT family transporter [Anaerolineales bacterium]|nr:DMT family transporter [Anaerolineales bacterium]
MRADLVLLLVALIWGSAFVVQRVAGQSFDPFTFNGLRFLLGGLLILPFAVLGSQKRPALPQTSPGKTKEYFIFITLAGLLLFGAGGLQQAGLEITTAGNAGFITSLYVVIVPLLLALIWKQRLPRAGWGAACLAVFGSFLLSTGGTFRLESGDVLELAGSVLWALHVILVGRAMRRLDVLSFSAGQYLVAGALNMLISLLTRQSLAGLQTAWWTVLYIGCLSTAIGYTLQVYGQKTAPAADAAILLSMEAVFAALTGYVFLDERLVFEQIIGCAFILGAILLAQIRVKNLEHATIP